MSENVDAYKGKWLKMLMQIGKMAENVDAVIIIIIYITKLYININTPYYIVLKLL